MRRLLHLDAAAILPPRTRVLARAGVPEGRAPSSRTLDLAARATELFLAEAAPVGVVEELALDEFLSLCRDGRPGDEAAVVERVAPLARRLALFAGTVGEPICARIRTLFAEGEAPLGLLLDAVASEAAATLADELGETLVAGGDGAGLAVLAYSPGYCGWPVTGQRELFARLAPTDAGISLSESALMAPVKSVSGVLVAAPPEAHRFRPGFDFCEACADRTCLDRMAALPREEGETPWRS